MRLKTDRPFETTGEMVSQSPRGPYTTVSFKCVECLRVGDVLFMGSSYCQDCYGELSRTGKLQGG